ncbi:hypothetical protein ACH437_23795 [Streptomyces xinghaiensis]|uniref:hypothetical protein n=1 Tax=Streptomyces xinghaiensis TaxID=1038928 RepID=UPI0037A4A52A
MLSPGLLTHWTREALEAARGADEERAREITWRIVAGADVLDLLAVCRVAADTALRALLVLYRRPDPDRGEAWVLDHLGNAERDPAQLFAARLVTAYANCDHDHVTALVAAAAGASLRERAESLRTLLAYAAGLDARAAQPPPDGRNLNDEH